MSKDFLWDDMRFFLAASRAETLTQAARQLKVSQPTVGRRLRALEEKLGAPLLERLPDRIRLTPAGRRLLPFAEEMERQTLGLAQAVEALPQQKARLVRVTAIGSVALFFARRFRALEALVTPLSIELNSSGERLNLARHEADIALRMNRVPTRGELVCRKIGHIAYALYASPQLAEELSGRPATGPFIGYLKNPRKKSQSSWLFAYGQAGSFPLRVNELHLRFEAARAGIGTTLLPCHLGDASPELQRVHAPIPELEEEIYLLMHESRRAETDLRRVADALAELVHRDQASLLGLAPPA